MDENQNRLQRIIPVEIESEMKKSFIDYAMSVIVDRALPDVRDGLKPVHRRIIYSMYDQGFTPEKPYRKCATTVGDVMGKYHPHGDAAIYESLVRLAQDFSMRYVMVDGHGNFGSRDNDPPAAMRYTESKLAKISMEMLADINKNTVDFRPNFDEHEMEPSVLPSRYPNLLVNGSSGIAVGMATNIPPHNLREVIDGVIKVIDEPLTTIDELMMVIKGPDFPTGANILGRQGIREAYRTGRGRIIVRAEANIEEMPNGRQRIIVSELPYQVNNAKLVERIDELVKEKRVEGISELRDEYGKEGIRIVIELKRDANANVVLNQLYKFTPMQEAFNVNMLAIVPVPGAQDKYEPKVVNLRDIVDYYLAHQKSVITRRTQFELDNALDRVHILEGFLIALDNIDEVIKIIRGSETVSIAKERLIERFQLSERQAQNIVDMRLGRLTGLEREKILDEYNELQKKITYYRDVLANEYMVFNIIKDEMNVIKTKFGDDRRTRIVAYEGEIDLEDLITETEIAVTLTHFGYIKRSPADTFKAQRRGGKGIIGLTTREEDFVEQLFITSSHNRLLFITNMGKVFSLKGYEIPDSGRVSKGMAIVNLLQLGPEEKVATVIPITSFDEDKYLLIATKNGILKKTALKEYSNIRKGGLIAIELRDDDKLINAALVSAGQNIMMVTEKGMAIRFSDSDIRATGRASMGVRGIRLKSGDRVIGMDVLEDDSNLLIITEKGFGKRTELSEYKVQSRGGMGVLTYRISEKTGNIAGMMLVNDSHDVVMITTEGTIIRIHAKDINIIGRATRGVTLMRTKENNMVVSCARTMAEEEADAALPETNDEGEVETNDINTGIDETDGNNGKAETNFDEDL
ncbi:MAG: DNA gyrase subunit A [Clostridiales bacterium]|jgi:DNA gyrase subunit A|nr:DNA gyrase subunit A [Clostridiales bacterium]